MAFRVRISLVWGLEFGVWSLGFGVWGLEVGIGRFGIVRNTHLDEEFHERDAVVQRRPMQRLEGFRVQGSGCRVQGAGCRVQGSGCRVQGAGFRVQGA